MSLSEIISAEEHNDIARALRRQDNPVSKRAADIIDQLMGFILDNIYEIDDLYNAAENFVQSEAVVHQMYPNTATCRSGPGVIAGQAFTRHCAVTCSNSVHQDSAREYREAKAKLLEVLESVRKN